LAEQLTAAREGLLLMEDDNPALRMFMGRRLGGIRRLHKVPQGDVAKHLGVSRPHLSNIELGRARTGWGGLRRMAEFYHLRFEELLEDCSRTLAGEAPYQQQQEGRMHSGEKLIQTPELVTDDERLVLGMFRLLDGGGRQQIASEILKLVQQRSQRIGDNDKKV
jgi:transcriptional regulator with XRE-family HTH domain